MVSFLETLTLGALYGLGPCTIFCAPILTSLIIGSAKSGKEGIIQFFSFGFGRISSYIFLGGISGYTGHLLSDLISQRLIGIFLVFLGIFIILRYFFGSRNLKGRQGHSHGANCPSFLAKTKNKEVPFITGLVIGLSPCPPLLALLALAVLEKSFLIGVGMGLTFGIGSLVSPLIILGFFAGKLAALKELKTGGNVASGLFLILFGLWKAFFNL